MFDAGGGFNGDLILGHNAEVVEILGCTADDVACHGAGAAVAIEHAHFRIGDVGVFH